MDRTLRVYSSNRALMQDLSADELLSPHMMIGEFFSQLVIVDGYRALPQAMRLPLSLGVLRECAQKLVGAKLVFEESFLGFLETSNFLFSFFDELAQAQVPIANIPLFDTYGDYEDHLQVLEWVENRYKERLEEHKYYDGFIMPPQAKMRINEAFIRHFDEIEICVEGVISPIHQWLLKQAASMTLIKVRFWLDSYNIHLDFLPREILSSCKPNHRYVADYQHAKILESTPLSLCARIHVYSFGLGISQVALVFAKIREWIEAGIDEEDIVVIVPNEDFAKYLALLDRGHNFNFAMGRDIALSAAYKHLERLLEQEGDSQYSYEVASEMIRAALEVYEDRQSKKVREYVSELLFIWGHLNLGVCMLGEILSLLLTELKHRSVDDIHGGKIRVMGVLESRGFVYKKAVIVDCNHDVIPHVSESDLFLNSRLRSALGMPTLKDKEQLQKHYYYGIFSTADEVAVAFVANEDKQPSLLLDELARQMQVQYHNGDSLFCLLPQGRVLEYCEDEICGVLPKILTPSKLKTLLECRRKYYYRYVERMSEVGNTNADLGNIVHECLESVYKPFVGKVVRLDIKEIMQRADSWLDGCVRGSALQSTEIELLKCELRGFFTQALLSEKQGEIEILQLEGENMELNLQGFAFYMRPDRIQRVGECVEIIDYKYRNNFKVQSLDKASDFALNLYAMAFAQSGGAYSALPLSLCYWDIRAGEVKQEEARKAEILPQKLAELAGEIEFTKTLDRQQCRYCDFADLCER